MPQAWAVETRRASIKGRRRRMMVDASITVSAQPNVGNDGRRSECPQWRKL
jgi:hypothetical protein